jgi:hypothetical protein
MTSPENHWPGNSDLLPERERGHRNRLAAWCDATLFMRGLRANRKARDGLAFQYSRF